MTTPRIDLRPGVPDPVVLMISRRQVEQGDVDRVVKRLRPFTATREDAWLYRGQMSLVVSGYEDDPRAIVNIPEARMFLKRLTSDCPFWGFFFNHLDGSLVLLRLRRAGERGHHPRGSRDDQAGLVWEGR